MKVKTTIHIYYAAYPWEDKAEYLVFYAKVSDDEHRTYVGEQEIEIEVPDNYDPTAQKLAALQKEKEKVQLEFAQKVADINDRISKLQALEYTA
tara:strand:- start:2154 stop:2435 length:282 start_codon:yes stop_codon:yes gene_type:complete